jgi:hypothetical protein
MMSSSKSCVTYLLNSTKRQEKFDLFGWGRSLGRRPQKFDFVLVGSDGAIFGVNL